MITFLPIKNAYFVLPINDLSFAYGLVNRTTYIERIVSLYELMDIDSCVIMDSFPKYGQRFYKKLIEINKEEDKQSWYKGEFGTIRNRVETNNNILEFYQTKNSGRDCNWEFYNKDPDPHPSVPHGHGIEKTMLRLDPYKRCIFNKQNGRLKLNGFEKRKYIIDLWNDDNFRKYALKAITNFIDSGIVGRNYNWYRIRGIRNPYKLPRK